MLSTPACRPRGLILTPSTILRWHRQLLTRLDPPTSPATVVLLTTAKVPRRGAADDLVPLLGAERTPGRRARAANPLPRVQVPAQHGAAHRRRPQCGSRRFPDQLGLRPDVARRGLIELANPHLAEPGAVRHIPQRDAPVVGERGQPAPRRVEEDPTGPLRGYPAKLSTVRHVPD